MTFIIFKLVLILEFQIDFILCIANHTNALRISKLFFELAINAPMYLKCVTLLISVRSFYSLMLTGIVLYNVMTSVFFVFS